MSPPRFYTQGWDDYELIDAGNGKKLERWGSIITIRPEVQAYFKPGETYEKWLEMAHWEFIETTPQTGEWHALKSGKPQQWQISYGRLRFQLELTRFKHVGLFPEQRFNWDFIKLRINPETRFLNLFAYTGAASCMARKMGAETLHVDSAKSLLTWAHTNMELSHLSDIKWVHEDALKFAERELRRGKRYHGIIMDPPAWGTGASGEKWKLESKLPELVEAAQGLLAKGGFLILNTYSPSISVPDLAQLAEDYFNAKHIELGELWMRSSTGKELYYGNLLRIDHYLGYLNDD